MSVEHVELVVEEPSMEAALRLLLPSMLNGISFEIYQHQCKRDLLMRLPERLRGYARWIKDSWRIVVIVDRDDDECDNLKRRLEEMAKDAGLRTRSMVGGGKYMVVNRLAIEELEAWYFGDWQAVHAAFQGCRRPSPRRPPTAIPTPSPAAPGKRSSASCSKPGTSRPVCARSKPPGAVAAQMNHARNRSPSFKALRDALLEMVPA